MQRNKTSSYLIPTIDDTTSNSKLFTIDTLKSYGFVNAFLDFKEFRKATSLNTNDCLWFLFLPDKQNIADWKYFRSIYLKLPSYIGEIDYDIGIVIILFKIKEKYRQFPKYLMEGKYSKMDTGRYASIFTIDQGTKTLLLKQFLVITKDESYRNDLSFILNVNSEILTELDDIPDIENEYLTKELIEKIKNEHKR
jgi:hypothetical protein